MANLYTSNLPVALRLWREESAALNCATHERSTSPGNRCYRLRDRRVGILAFPRRRRVCCDYPHCSSGRPRRQPSAASKTARAYTSLAQCGITNGYGDRAKWSPPRPRSRCHCLTAGFLTSVRKLHTPPDRKFGTVSATSRFIWLGAFLPVAGKCSKIQKIKTLAKKEL